MTRIVTAHYRYKPAPRKRKAVAIEVPEVVTIPDRKRRRAATRTEAASEPKPAPPSPANDDVGKPTKPAAAAIVTIRRKSRFGKAEDITEEEANRRADLANKMMQDFKRQIAEKLRK